MKQNVEHFPITPSTSLENKEGYAVDFEGAVSTSTTKGCLGIVGKGRPADMASEIEIKGMTEAVVDGGTASVSVNDPLAAGGGTNDGTLAKATIGTDIIRAFALESASSETKIKVFLI